MTTYTWASVPTTLTVNTTANTAAYKSNGADVTGYFYKPSGDGPFPAVMLLHGKSGQSKTPPTECQWFVAQGFVVFAPDYFTPVGLTAENYDNNVFNQTEIDPVRELLANGLEALKSLPCVNPKRMVVAGFSLGGQMAFILASRDDVSGAVSYYGAYPPVTKVPRWKYQITDIISQIKAPVIMFHGDKDELVPIANAELARDLLSKYSKRFDYIVYPGAQHSFNAPAGPTASPQATADSKEKMLAFFKTIFP